MSGGTVTGGTRLCSAAEDNAPQLFITFTALLKYKRDSEWLKTERYQT